MTVCYQIVKLDIKMLLFACCINIMYYFCALCVYVDFINSFWVSS